MRRRRSKFGARAITIDGHRFASTGEYRRFSQLLLLGNAGLLTNLELQPKFPIVINGQHVCNVFADFRYTDEHGRDVVEDFKGQVLPMFTLKKKLVKAIYGIDIQEVR